MAAAPSQQAAGRWHEERSSRAYIGLGSNLGDPVAQLRAALTHLAGRWTIVARSSVYATAPVGGPSGQREYLNAVVAVSAPGADPHQLLLRLLNIEHDMGRTRGERWGPRLIDLDLLALGDVVVGGWHSAADAHGADHGPQAGELVLPHPRLAERAFVLVPLCEIAALRNESAPPWLHPVTGLDACAMLAALAGSQAESDVAAALGVRRTDLRW